MATVAHCLYCFETLSASLEHRKPLSLAQVDAFWRRYCADQLQHGSIPPNLEPDESSGQIGLEEVEENRSDDEDTNVIELNSRPLKAQKTIASIFKGTQQSDLKALSPSPGPSSSSSPTPSAASKASSMRTDSSVSISSSRSSLSSASQTASKKARNPHSERHPMFITWTNIGSNNSRTLRGCIGTFESQVLDEGLGTYALTSLVPLFPPRSYAPCRYQFFLMHITARMRTLGFHQSQCLSSHPLNVVSHYSPISSLPPHPCHGKSALMGFV